MAEGFKINEGKLEILEGNYIQAQTCFYKILSIKNDVSNF